MVFQRFTIDRETCRIMMPCKKNDSSTTYPLNSDIALMVPLKTMMQIFNDLNTIYPLCSDIALMIPLKTMIQISNDSNTIYPLYSDIAHMIRLKIIIQTQASILF